VILLNISDGQIVPQEDGRMKFLGSPTECALLVFIRSFNLNEDEVHEKFVKAYTIDFTSDRKRMSTVVHLPVETRKHRLYCKGASEVVLRRCTRMLKPNGKTESISKSTRRELDEFIISLASRGLRTLVLAYRDLRRFVKTTKTMVTEEELEKNL